MFTFLLIVHAIIAAALVGVILMQRSEGGGLGMGGSPSGLMSARGAADFLTRATTVLGSLFVVMSIGLAVMATVVRAPSTIDASLARRPAPTAPLPGSVPAGSAAAGSGVPLAGDPLTATAAGALQNGATPIVDTPITNPPATVRRDPAGGDAPRPATRAATRKAETEDAPKIKAAPVAINPPAVSSPMPQVKPQAPPANAPAPAAGNSSVPLAQ